MRIQLAVLLVSFFVMSSYTFAQTNAQTGDLNTNTQDSTVSSYNETQSSTTTNNYNGAGSASKIPPGSAISPSYMSNGSETCLQGASGGLQTNMIGFSAGGYQEDEHCNRRRDAKVLNDLGMKVAAVSRMCEDILVWRSMFVSGTPCPILHNGKMVVGKRAYLVMKMNPEIYIPDYGEVKQKKSWKGNKPDEVVYTETQLWYNTILGIGVEENAEEDTSDSSISVSERFRSNRD